MVTVKVWMALLYYTGGGGLSEFPAMVVVNDIATANQCQIIVNSHIAMAKITSVNSGYGGKCIGYDKVVEK